MSFLIAYRSPSLMEYFSFRIIRFIRKSLLKKSRKWYYQPPVSHHFKIEKKIPSTSFIKVIASRDKGYNSITRKSPRDTL